MHDGKEQETVEPFIRKVPNNSESQNFQNIDKLRLSRPASVYMDCWFLLSTTNLVKRLCFKARYALGKRSRQITPESLEIQ